MESQEIIALFIVGSIGLWMLFKLIRSLLKGPVFRMLIRQGKTKWALTLKHYFGSSEEKGGCSGCKGNCK